MSKVFRYYYTGKIPQKILRSIRLGIQKNQYSQEVPEGFLVHTARDNLLSAEYIARSEKNISLVDPIGVERSFSSIEFSRCRFSLNDDRSHLRTEDAGRTENSCLNQLSQFSSFGIPIEPLQVDCLKWAKNLVSRVKNGHVYRLLCTGLSLSSLVKCDFLVSGSAFSDIESDLVKFTKGKNWSPKTCRIHFTINDKEQRLELSGNGKSRSLIGDMDKMEIDIYRSIPD